MFVPDPQLLVLGAGLLFKAFLIWFASYCVGCILLAVRRAWAARLEPHTWDVDIFDLEDKRK